MGNLIIFITLLLSIFGFSQFYGSVIYGILKGKIIPYIWSLIIWFGILFGYYLIIINFFQNYFNYYLYPTVIGAILAIISIKKD